MGKTSFDQLKNLPTDIRDHGVTNVYTIDEMNDILANYTPGSGGGSGTVDVSVERQSGVFTGTEQRIAIAIEDYSLGDPILFFVQGFLQNNTEYYIDNATNEIVLEEMGEWAAGSSYEIILIEGKDTDGNDSPIVSYRQFGTIEVDSQDTIPVTISQYNPNTDHLLLYIGGIFKTLGVEYTIDTETTEIVFNENITVEAGWPYTAIVFKDIGSVSELYGNTIDGALIEAGSLAKDSFNTELLGEFNSKADLTIVKARFVNALTSYRYGDPRISMSTCRAEVSEDWTVTIDDATNEVVIDRSSDASFGEVVFYIYLFFTDDFVDESIIVN